MESNDLQTGFYFNLSISRDKGSNDSAFQEVSGLSKELGVEEVVSGGENRFKYKLPNGVSHSNLVLKRGVARGDSTLVKWCKSVLDGGFGRPVTVQDVTVELYDAEGKTCMSWTFNRAWPVKWQVSDLKSQENSLLIETVELAYQYFEIGTR
jgi:phage tail-like protein